MSDDRGISARIGRPWTAGGDVAVDRLMWQAVCVVGRRLAGVGGSRSSSSSNSNNNNISCLPVIDTKSLEIRNFVRTQIWLDRLKMLLRSGAISKYPNMQSSLLKDISVKNRFNNYLVLYYNADIWLIPSLKY